LQDDSLVNWVREVHAELHVERLVERLEPLLGSEIDKQAVERELQQSTKAAAEWLAAQTVGLAGVAVGLLGGLVSALVKLAMFVIALYYFLADGVGFVRAAEHLIPVQPSYQRELIEKFNVTTRAVVVGTFMAAVSQGVTTGVLLYFFGFREFLVLWPLATFCSLIPVFGTALVWGPCALWLVAAGQWWSAFFLVALGASVVGSLDNVVRAYVLQTDAKLHPLLGFVCVLGGIQVMGLWGVFIGPLVASILHALIVIFNTELDELSKHRAAEQPPDDVAAVP
jgi:predicted PurR-regulated permease PerM